MQGKEYGGPRRGKGRGGSRGRGEDYVGGRGGGVGGGSIVPLPRAAATQYNTPPRGPQEQPAPAVVRVEPPRPAPEFNMKTNDFPALPGAAAAARKQMELMDPATPWESSRFLDIVKGTAKVKLGDESDSGHNTKETSPVPPDDQDSADGDIVDNTADTNTCNVLDVSVESTSVESAPTVVNGEVKGSGKTPLVSINSPVAVSGNEASSDSTSPRTQSLEALGPKLTYAQMAQKKKEAKEREAAAAAAAAAASTAAGGGTAATAGGGEKVPEQNKAKEAKHSQGSKGGDDIKKDTSSVSVITSDSHDRDGKQRLVKTLSQPGESRSGADKSKGRANKRLERTDSVPVQSK